MKILFLGETYRADAITWIRGIENSSGVSIETAEIESSKTRFGRLGNAFSFFLKLIRDRVHSSYDLVLAERSTSYGLFSLLVKAKVRVVAQQGITDAYPETGFSGFYKRRIQNHVYRKVDIIHAWGAVMLEAMVRSGTSLNKIVVRPKGIDLDNYSSRNPILKKIPSGIVTRSLSDVYHHEVILEAVHLLKKRGVPFRCIIVGDGPLRGQLEKLAGQLDILDLVDFKGRIPNDQLPRELRESEFYISMPETEGVSASLFEAMACGCLPIVTDLRANRQFIKSRKNGFLVPVNQPEVLCDMIHQAITDYDSFLPGIRENRRFVENEADLKKNMAYFYSVYSDRLDKVRSV